MFGCPSGKMSDKEDVKTRGMSTTKGDKTTEDKTEAAAQEKVRLLRKVNKSKKYTLRVY